MRRRSPSYSPPPRRRSPSPRRRYSSRRDPPTSLLVRNLPKDCRHQPLSKHPREGNQDWNQSQNSKEISEISTRADDLRGPFERFGHIRDIYLPRDYYTGEPRGFGFVQYLDPVDAEEAQYHMNHQILHGRELTVVFAEENRKKPGEMRARDRGRLSSGHDWRHRSPYYYGRSRSRSPRDRSRSSRGRHYSISSSPERRRARERSYSSSPVRSSPSPVRDTHKGRHAQSASDSKRAFPDRENHNKFSGKDMPRSTRSPPRSPSLPPRRGHSSRSYYSRSKTPNKDQSEDDSASPVHSPLDD